MHIQFVEIGSAENPFAPRDWQFVPRVGEHVVLPETGSTYRIVGVCWHCRNRGDGRDQDREPRVVVTVVL